MAVAGKTAPALWLQPADDGAYHVLHSQNVGTDAMPSSPPAALSAMLEARRRNVKLWILARHAVQLRQAGYVIQPRIGV